MNGLRLGTGVANGATTSKTHEDVGKDAERPDAPRGDAPLTPPATADDGVVRWSSHPILKYKVGRFRFENGLLELREPQDVEDFQHIHDNLPKPEQIRIKKLDLSAAEAQVRKVLGDSPKASKGIDSDTGGRDPGKQVGKGELGDSQDA
jgi:hypothetical protein